MYVLIIRIPRPCSAKRFSGGQRIGNLLGIEPFSFIAHDEEKFSVRLATKAQVNELLGVFVVAVDHGVGDGFAERYFDIAAITVKTCVMLHAFNEFIDERGDF